MVNGALYMGFRATLDFLFDHRHFVTDVSFYDIFIGLIITKRANHFQCASKLQSAMKLVGAFSGLLEFGSVDNRFFFLASY